MPAGRRPVKAGAARARGTASATPVAAGMRSRVAYPLAVGQGKVAEAIVQFSEAVRLDPELAEAHSNLGTSLARQGRDDDAIREFLEAVRLKPAQPDFHYNVAIMFGRKDNAAEALQHFEEALAIDSTYAAARQGLAQLTPRD